MIFVMTEHFSILTGAMEDETGVTGAENPSWARDF